MGLTKYPGGVFASPNIGGGAGDVFSGLGNAVFFVDGDNGNDGNDGTDPAAAKLTIQSAVTAAAVANAAYKGGSTVYIKPKAITDATGDPASYAEVVIIPFAGGERMRLIGCGTGRTQGGLPQIKMGSGSNALLTIRAPGCSIEGIGFNGYGSTGGGILLDDDNSTKSAFGTTINGCHIKNCVGSTATNGLTGGGIMWSAQGNAWQVSITNNMFYKNVSDIALMGTLNTRPQDILIQGNVFQSSVTSSCDCNILGNGAGGGFQTITIDRNVFSDIPALSSGTHATYIELTGTLGGMLTNNVFGIIASEAASNVTFGAAGTVLIPTTVFMAGNQGEPDDSGASNDFGGIFRT